MLPRVALLICSLCIGTAYGATFKFAYSWNDDSPYPCKILHNDDGTSLTVTPRKATLISDYETRQHTMINFAYAFISSVVASRDGILKIDLTTGRTLYIRPLEKENVADIRDLHIKLLIKMLEVSDIHDRVVVSRSVKTSVPLGDSSTSCSLRTGEREIEGKQYKKPLREKGDRKAKNQERQNRKKRLSSGERDKSTERVRDPDKIVLSLCTESSSGSDDATADGLIESEQRGDEPKQTRIGSKDKTRGMKAKHMKRFASSGRLPQVFRGTGKSETSPSRIDEVEESKSIKSLNLRMDTLSLGKTSSSKLSPRSGDGHNRSPRRNSPRILVREKTPSLNKAQDPPRERKSRSRSEDEDKDEEKDARAASENRHGMPSPRRRRDKLAMKIQTPQLESSSESSGDDLVRNNVPSLSSKELSLRDDRIGRGVSGREQGYQRQKSDLFPRVFSDPFLQLREDVEESVVREEKGETKVEAEREEQRREGKEGPKRDNNDSRQLRPFALENNASTFARGTVPVLRLPPHGSPSGRPEDGPPRGHRREGDGRVQDPSSHGGSGPSNWTHF